MVEGEARDHGTQDQGQAEDGLLAAHDLALLALGDAVRDQGRQRRNSEAGTYRQYPDDGIEQRAERNQRHQTEIDGHQREADDQEPLLAEARLELPEQHALREHGAHADEREEEGVGGGVPPEAGVAEERKVGQKSREGQIQQEDGEQQRPDAAHTQNSAQLRDRVEAQDRGRSPAHERERFRQYEEAERHVAESQRGGGEGRG